MVKNIRQRPPVGRWRIKAIAAIHARKAQQIPLTASIGVAFIDAQTPFAAALSQADAALYRAKNEGRDRVCVA
ncbi:MAG: GGDEF domain-containing protein [Casimicrobium sp.]